MSVWDHSIWWNQMALARHALKVCSALETDGYLVDLDNTYERLARHMSPREFQQRMRWHQEWIAYGTTVPHAYAETRSRTVPWATGESTAGDP